MIISRTPFRVSLLGGGTDYPAWYHRHGGAVLGTAINKYCYISIRHLPPFFSHRHRIVYSQIELVRELEEIVHPAVRGVMSDMSDCIDGGVEIQHAGDLPARSGLGSSSSFTVGLINVIHALKGRMVSSRELAEDAIRIEQHVIKEDVGSQDQIWAAFGGLNHITFERNNSFRVAPLIMSQERIDALNASMLLFFTGFSRFSGSIAAKQIANLSAREAHLRAMADMVDDGAGLLQNADRDLDALGKLLHESWQLKRELADTVSNDQIDEIYEAGKAGGAIGGKILGAGGGGFMLFYAPPQTHDEIRARLSSLIEVSFKINSSGSSIVHYEPNGIHA